MSDRRKRCERCNRTGKRHDPEVWLTLFRATAMTVYDPAFYQRRAGDELLCRPCLFERLREGDPLRRADGGRA